MREEQILNLVTSDRLPDRVGPERFACRMVGPMKFDARKVIAASEFIDRVDDTLWVI